MELWAPRSVEAALPGPTPGREWAAPVQRGLSRGCLLLE